MEGYAAAIGHQIETSSRGRQKAKLRIAKALDNYLKTGTPTDLEMLKGALWRYIGASEGDDEEEIFSGTEVPAGDDELLAINE